MRIAFILTALICCHVAAAATAQGDVTVQWDEHGFNDDKVAKVTVTDQTEAVFKIRAGEFFGKQMVYANPTITNKASEPLLVSVNVAFFNAEGALVGCCSQSSFGDEGLAAGADENFASRMVGLLTDVYKTITRYQIAVYENPLLALSCA